MSGPRIVDTASMEWAASPSPTVWRKRIEHDGPPEAGRVTSVVRYEPGSSFHSHPHPQGEEILVLEGVFSDEHGDHPAGTHLLNPEGFEHAPRSAEGCVLFVKLRQYAGEGREQRVTDTTDEAGWTVEGGIQIRELYAQEGFPERLRLVRLSAGSELLLASGRGVEVFVVSGTVTVDGDRAGQGAWFKPAADSGLRVEGVQGGAVLYVRESTP